MCEGTAGEPLPTAGALHLGEDDIAPLGAPGSADGGIPELNQVVSDLACWNRVVPGLGAPTDGDVLGLSPSSEPPDDWSRL